jgi:dihydroorotase
LQAAQRLSTMFSLPLMVQLGQFPQAQTMTVQELLPQLKAGDIITHCFQPDAGLFDASGELLPVAKEAIARGVVLDVGYNSTNFAIATAQSALNKGILPDTLSTDLSTANANPANHLAAAMSLFVSLGLSLSDVVERVTSRPAKAIGKSSELGGFKPGQLADFTIFEWAQEGDTESTSPSNTLTTTHNTASAPAQLLQVKGVYHNGEYLRIERSPFAAIADAPIEPALV